MSNKSKLKTKDKAPPPAAIVAEPSGSSLVSNTTTTTTSTSLAPTKLIDVLKAFEVKVEVVLGELARQNNDVHEHQGVKQTTDRLYRWLVKMNDYLRNLCSGFRARLLSPMASLPELKQKQVPLSSSLVARQQGGGNTVVDLHRIYHSLKCAVIVVPELLLVTHLFASNQLFCNSLSELLTASERELWQDQPLITERNCHQLLPKMVTSVNRLLQCTRIAGDWLQQHQDEQLEDGQDGATHHHPRIVPTISVETSRLQRLLNCQKLLKSKLEVVTEELSSLDVELSNAASRMQPLLYLQDVIEERTSQAMAIQDTTVQVIRRIKAIENEIILPVNNNHQRNNKKTTKKQQPAAAPAGGDDGDSKETDNSSSLVTMSQVCRTEILTAQRKLNLLDYLKEIAMEDIEETCMIMPFVVRQTDYMQTIVDRLEAAIDDKQATRLHLENTLAFISQEVECATHLCGQVKLGGFTDALHFANSVSIDVGAPTSSRFGAEPEQQNNNSKVTAEPFASTGNNNKNRNAAAALQQKSTSNNNKGGDDQRHKPLMPAAVVYIKRRHHSQLSQNNSDSSSSRR